jgi:tRNA threonylcarbamoyladenosine biosynthesis protein TsaB
MALILSIETATPICSVALHQNGQLMATQQSLTPQSTASQLAVLIDSLFKNSNISIKLLKAVAVSAGPGSYTGLRIGVATAKGICYANSIPLLSISTLELMAHTIIASRNSESNALLCPMLDARRMEVYCLLANSIGKTLEPMHARVIDANSFADWLNKNVIYFFGDGAAKCEGIVNHPNARFLSNFHPHAKEMGLQAEQKFKASNSEDVIAFEPFYLKDFMIKKPNSE